MSRYRAIIINTITLEEEALETIAVNTIIARYKFNEYISEHMPPHTTIKKIITLNHNITTKLKVTVIY